MKQNKQQKRNIFLIILGFFIALINLVAFGLSVGFGAVKTTIGSDFSKSYNLKYEFDPYSKNDNPADGYYTKEQVTLSGVQSKMNSISKAYSQILIGNGTPADNVYPEVYQDKEGYIKAFLNVTIPVSQTTKSSYTPVPSDHKEDKIDIAPGTSYYSNIQSANFSILYCDGYDLASSSTEPSNDISEEPTNTFNKAKLYMWNLTERNGDCLVDDDNKIELDGTANQINIKLKDGLTFGDKKSDDDSETDYVEGSIKDTFKKAKDGKSNNEETETSKYPFMYIIHNLRGLINELEYCINVSNLYWRVGTDGTDSNLYNAYWQLTQEQKNFAEAMGVGEHKDASKIATYLNPVGNFYTINEFAFDSGSGFQQNPYSKLISSEWSNLSSAPLAGNNSGFYYSTNNFRGSSIFRIIQAAGASLDPEPGKSADVNTSYTFINKYIVGIVTKDNYTDYLPDKNPNKADIDSDGLWLTIKPSNNQYYTARQLKDQMTSQKFSMPMMSVSYPGPNQSGYEPYTNDLIIDNRIQLNGVNGFNKNSALANVDVKVDSNIAIINNSLGKSIVQIDQPALTSVICLAVIVLIVGIIVSILYRIPGFVMWACQITPVALIFLILGLCGNVLTLGTVIAAAITYLASTIASILLLNKMKRNHLSHKTMDQAVNNAYAKSFFAVLDIFVVTLLLGIAPIFFPGTSIMMCGLALIIGSLLGFIFTYFVSWLGNFLIFNNGAGMYKNEWLSNVKTSINHMINPQYKTVYDNQMPKFQPFGFTNEGYVSKVRTPFKLTFNKLSNIITWIVVAVVCAVGLSIMFTIGIPQSTNFYGGTRLMILIPTDTTNINGYIDPIVQALNNSDINGWYGGLCDGAGHYYFIETINSYTYSSVASALTAAGISGINFSVSSIDPSISNDLALNATYVMLIFLGFMFIYGFIRYNWITLLPNLVVGALTIATTLAIATLIRLPIDTNIMYGLFMASAVVYMTIYALLGSIFPKWVKKLHPIYNDLTFLMNYGITVFNDNKILIYIICGVMIVPSIVFMPVATLPMIAVFAIGVVIGAILVNMTWPLFLKAFVSVHNNYSNRIKRIQVGIDKLNLDKVDEELINGININTKEIE
ncbi:MAG: hypothetical protein HUJ52_00460 [Malacoplasma sp.]|nr:hypothetical protein [Malacoplasma sp.]